LKPRRGGKKLQSLKSAERGQPKAEGHLVKKTAKFGILTVTGVSIDEETNALTRLCRSEKKAIKQNKTEETASSQKKKTDAAESPL